MNKLISSVSFPLMQDHESFGECISFPWVMKMKNKVNLYLMDLVVGEIIYKHTAIEQCFLVRRYF